MNELSNKLEAIREGIANAYDAVEAKGGTLPTTQDLAHLATAVQSVPSGSVSQRYVEYDESENTPNTYLINGVVTSYNGWTTSGYILLKKDCVYCLKMASYSMPSYCSLFDLDENHKKTLGIVFSSTGTTWIDILRYNTTEQYLRISINNSYFSDCIKIIEIEGMDSQFFIDNNLTL